MRDRHCITKGNSPQTQLPIQIEPKYPIDETPLGNNDTLCEADDDDWWMWWWEGMIPL